MGSVAETMKREYHKIDEIDAYDEFHVADGDGFKVIKRDPQGYAEHRTGVDDMKKLLMHGVKFMPILVQRRADGTLKRLDGFKRWQAHKELGIPLIETFTCEPGEEGKTFNYNGTELICKSGGQSYRRFPSIVEYGEDPNQKVDSGIIVVLYGGRSFRIEYREAIHVHWGENGRNRIILGRRDFDLLADTFERS